MHLGIVFNLYQPSVLDNETFSKIVESSYYPLLKLIKNSKNIGFTLNIPLSTSFLLKERGYGDFLKTVKDLTESEKVELTSCGAYYPLFSTLPKELVEKQIILNEFSLGYYFGKDKGFEGEDAILIKNINGFYPPDLSIDNNLLQILESLNYKWVLVDEANLLNTDSEASVFVLPEKNIKLVVPSKNLTSMIISKKSTDNLDIISRILATFENQEEIVLNFDAQYFGFEFNDGIFLLDSILENLRQKGIRITTISNILSKAGEEALPGLQSKSIDTSVIESFPKQFNTLLATQAPLTNVSLPKESDITIDTLPVWDSQYVSKVKNAELGDKLLKNNLYMQCMSYSQIDQNLKDRYLKLYEELGISA